MPVESDFHISIYTNRLNWGGTVKSLIKHFAQGCQGRIIQFLIQEHPETRKQQQYVAYTLVQGSDKNPYTSSELVHLNIYF